MHFVHASKEYVEHLFRESVREHHLEALEKRRRAGGRSLGGVPTTSGAGLGKTSMGARRPEPARAVCTPTALHVLGGAAGQEAARRGGLPPVPSGATQGAPGAVPVAPTAPPFPAAVSDESPRDWKLGPDFLPAMLRWLSELQWLPRDDSLPEAHRQVSFLELALDFESYTGRPLPPTPQTRFAGGEMSLQEKGRVLRLAVSLLGKAAGRKSILPVGFTNRCRSLVPLGAGTTAGVKGRPIFTQLAAVWHHVRRLQQYNAARWAQQQQARVTRQQSKRRRAQGAQAKLAGEQQSRKARCPGKGGAKHSAGAYASDFYAGPVIPPGARRGPQYRVTDAEDVPAELACIDRAALFTPPQSCAVARRPEQRPRLPRLWVCAAHQHRQCASCAAVGRGVRHGCAKGHAGHPWPPAALRGQRRGSRQAEVRAPGAGGTPSAKQRKRQRASGYWHRAQTECDPTSEGGWTRPPPPPVKRMRCQSPSTARHGRAGTEVA